MPHTLYNYKTQKYDRLEKFPEDDMKNYIPQDSKSQTRFQQLLDEGHNPLVAALQIVLDYGEMLG